MNRQIASQHLRNLLDAQSLEDWKIRLTTDITKPFLGMCSYKDKTIILNAFHIDTHPDEEVINTIRHEVAHALTKGHAHDAIWRSKAIEMGCDNTQECVSYSLDDRAIDAIRSGAQLEVTFDTEIIPEQIIRKPKYSINRLQDKCAVCGKVAKVKSRKEVVTSKGNKVVITLECNHIEFRDASSTSPFQTITFDGIPTCVHQWGSGKQRTTCSKCGAHRLYEFQVEGARSLERANGRMAIFDEMGLGKTLQPLAYLKFHPEAFPFLWITKSGVRFQHTREIMRLLGKEAFPQVLMSGKDTLIPGMSCVASYDIFRRLDLKMFIDHGFKAVIIDECQAIKNPDSSRTACIRQIVKHIPKIIPTSGTPWKNRGSEFFVVLNMLDPQRFHSYEAFKRQWVDTYYEGNKEKEGGIRNPEKFKEYISDIAIRRERVEVMPELPLINRTKLITEVPEHARSIYKQEEDKLIKILQDAIISGEEDSFATHQALNASLMVMKQIVGIAKVPATLEFAQDFLEETDRKLVIFVHHIECGKQILKGMQDYCLKEGYPQPLALSASMNGIERGSVAESFNKGSSRILIASTLASGEGLNLQACSDCIMHERQWNPQNEEQAEGRFIRIGQLAQSVNATYVHGDNTVDTVLDGIVERKRIAFHNSMNKGELPVWNVESMIKDLAKTIASQRS